MLIYFSPVNLNSIPQRPHHFVTWLSEAGVTKLIWVNPHLTRAPKFEDLGKLFVDRIKPGVRAKSASSIIALSPPQIPFEFLGSWKSVYHIFWLKFVSHLKKLIIPEEKLTIVVGKPSKLVLYAIKYLKPDKVIYDAMDNFSAFYDGNLRQRIWDLEEELAIKSDFIFVTSPFLEKRFSAFSSKVRLVPNGFDSKLIDDVRKVSKNPKRVPTISYIGTIASWFDVKLLHHIAQKNPDFQFRIIGPNFIPRETAALPNNVSFLGALPSREALIDVSNSDFAIIPFKVNQLTDGVDPVKFYELKALGLTVYSTRFGTMSERIDLKEARALTAETKFSTRPGNKEFSAQELANFTAANDWAIRFSTIKEFFDV
jgi:glycosyltransferase involved in cell wall biosynthesis